MEQQTSSEQGLNETREVEERAGRSRTKVGDLELKAAVIEKPTPRHGRLYLTLPYLTSRDYRDARPDSRQFGTLEQDILGHNAAISERPC